MKEKTSNRMARLTRREKCQICRKEKPVSEMVLGSLVRPSVVELIRGQHPDWTSSSYICLEDLHRFRMQHVQEVVAAEMGELSDLEKRVLSSMEKRSLIAEEVVALYERKLSMGARLARSQKFFR